MSLASRMPDERSFRSLQERQIELGLRGFELRGGAGREATLGGDHHASRDLHGRAYFGDAKLRHLRVHVSGERAQPRGGAIEDHIGLRDGRFAIGFPDARAGRPSRVEQEVDHGAVAGVAEVAPAVKRRPRVDRDARVRRHDDAGADPPRFCGADRARRVDHLG